VATRIYVDQEQFEPVDPFPWMDVAACNGLDTNRWFSTQRSVREEAKKVCLTKCSKRIECLAFVLAREKKGYRREGIYGGMTGNEREKLVERLERIKKEQEMQEAS
jgi:hypothetical protein